MPDLNYSGRFHIPRLRAIVCFLVFLGMSWAIASDAPIPAETGRPAATNAQLVKNSDDPDHPFTAVKRIQRINADADLPAVETAAVGDMIDLRLFDASVTAVIEKASVNRLGTAVIRGRLIDFPQGYVTLTKTANRWLGFIRIPEKNREYRIHYDPESRAHYLAEQDPEKKDMIRAGRPLTPTGGNSGEYAVDDTHYTVFHAPVLHSAHTDIDDAVTITVMVVYTAAAESWASNNSSGIQNVIATAMEETQVVLDNSETQTIVELVHAAQVSGKESEENGSSSDILERLKDPDDGYMDDVHEWRNRYNADLVALLAEVEDVGGIAFQLTDPAGDAEFGFSLTRVQQATGTWTLVHEIGHNIGLGHHKEQDFEPGPGLFYYSAGWRWQGNSDQWYNTIMTYWDGESFEQGTGGSASDSITMPYFSNPDLDHDGAATGHPVDGDNARTVREISPVIAEYRLEAPVINEFSVQSDAIKEGESTVLKWRVENADEVFIETDTRTAVGTVDMVGEREIQPEKDTTYTLTASNQIARRSEALTVTVESDNNGCFINRITLSGGH